SSSDGKFNTRYEAQDRFDELRTGSVAVKGGWRIYSSGPGIYMNQLISNVLGIRIQAGDLIIDPVLPERLNGLRFNFEIDSMPVTLVYHLTSSTETSVKINGEALTTDLVENPYRKGGVRIAKEEWISRLNEQQNTVDIFK